MPDQDYYSILGVLPDAEEVVIAAAYRALAKRYHPDTWKGDPAIANKRMSELNKAYEVLGDAVKRAAYDKKRGKAQSEFSTDDNDDQSQAFNSALNDVEEKWKTACSIFPDLKDLRAGLAKIETQLAFAFVTTLLETKDFNKRKEIAAHLERVCLERYFGTNEQIVNFGKYLVQNGGKNAAKLLNHLISVMGSGVDPKLIIGRVEKQFGIAYSANNAFAFRIAELKLEPLANRIRGEYCIEAEEGAIKLLRELGYTVTERSAGFFSTSDIEVSTPSYVTLPIINKLFPKGIGFHRWVQQQIL